MPLPVCYDLICPVGRKIVMKSLIVTVSMLVITMSSLWAQQTNPFTQKQQRVTTPPSKQVTPVINFQKSKALQATAGDGIYQHQQLKHGDHGLPIFIKSQASLQARGRMAAQTPETLSHEYLQEVAGLLQIENPAEEFQVKSIITSSQGSTHVKMQQMYQGYKVYAHEVILHLNGQGVSLFNGRHMVTPASLNTTPILTGEEATAMATRDVKKQPQVVVPQGAMAHILSHAGELPEPEVVIYEHPRKGKVNLVWHVTVYPNLVERWEYFIDARSGKTVNKYSHTCVFDGGTTGQAQDLNGDTRTVNIFEPGDGFFYLVDTSKPMFVTGQDPLPEKGVITTLDFRNVAVNSEEGSAFYIASADKDTWTDASAVSAHYNAEVAYNYYLNTFGRNSIDGNGGSIFSVVNVADEDGGGFDNAFWNGFAMFYGNGRNSFKPLAGGLDVGGHEMSHGVIQHTANLEYQDESGALNESFADVFGAMIDPDDWTMGEDIVKPGVFPNNALRDLSDPHNGGTKLGDRGFQPSHTSEMFTGSADNGGVHINSGIPNHAFFLFASAVGIELAQDVYYKTLTEYLTASSQFIDMRLAVIEAAAELTDDDPEVIAAAKSAFDAVGIEDGEGSEGNTDLPELAGDDLVMYFTTDTGDPHKLYIRSIETSEDTPISDLSIISKPSITDDGSIALFIAEDQAIHVIELSGSFPEEELSANVLWTNVAVSKDGTKLAAVTDQQDGTIFVHDFVSNQGKTFTLFNPTTVEGVKTGDVMYADALEWDYSGQFVMYDAFNRIEDDNGDDMEYWDVGFLNVWDNTTNAFAEGDIQKLFPSLPAGVSIGNPSFAKNSRDVVVFDKLDGDQLSVLAVNIETNTSETVFDNVVVGCPNYSRLDNKIIFNAIGSGDVPLIAIIDVDADRMTPTSDASVLLSNAKWGIWFSQGERELLKTGKNITSFDLAGIEDLTDVSILGNTIDITLSEQVDVSQLAATFTKSEGALVKIGDNRQISGITRNDFNSPLEYTVFAEDGSAKTYQVSITNLVTGLREEDLALDIEMFPNPTTGDLTLRAKRDIPTTIQVSVVDLLGRQVATVSLQSMDNGKSTVLPQFSQLPTGTYIVKAHTSDTFTIEKIIKQ